MLYCYTGQNAEESNLKRAAVLFQAEVKVSSVGVTISTNA